MKKADRNRQKRLQKKRERANAKRKGKTYNPQKHFHRYQHQDAQNADKETLSL